MRTCQDSKTWPQRGVCRVAASFPPVLLGRKGSMWGSLQGRVNARAAKPQTNPILQHSDRDASDPSPVVARALRKTAIVANNHFLVSSSTFGFCHVDYCSRAKKNQYQWSVIEKKILRLRTSVTSSCCSVGMYFDNVPSITSVILFPFLFFFPEVALPAYVVNTSLEVILSGKMQIVCQSAHAWSSTLHLGLKMTFKFHLKTAIQILSESDHSLFPPSCSLHVLSLQEERQNTVILCPSCSCTALSN